MDAVSQQPLYTVATVYTTAAMCAATAIYTAVYAAAAVFCITTIPRSSGPGRVTGQNGAVSMDISMVGTRL